jgi:ABC-type bacteriocin/lantibiotic exporter with double-glycine peptidase domain
MFFVDVLKKYKVKLFFTFALLVLDSLSFLLFPLLIGLAITDVMDQSMRGVYLLGALSVFNLAMGSFRRFYDSRVYAKIFSHYAQMLKTKEQVNETSKTVGRVNLLSESLGFMEESLPILLAHLIGIFGTLFILLSLNTIVFVICLVALLLSVIVYSLTSKRTLLLNKGYNNELERQVERIGNPNSLFASMHFKRLMKWNVRLSDLETLNFAVVWLIMIALMVASIFIISADSTFQLGAILSVVMYVFQFIESAMNLPLYYQQGLRLKEISKRLNSIL